MRRLALLPHCSCQATIRGADGAPLRVGLREGRRDLLADGRLLFMLVAARAIPRRRRAA